MRSARIGYQVRKTLFYSAIFGDQFIAPTSPQSQRRLRSVLRTLTPQEEQVLVLHYGLRPDCEGMTMAAIAKAFSRSRERIRQIRNKALRKLRHPSRAFHLRGER